MSKVLGKTTDLHSRYEQTVDEENPHKNSQLNNEETGVIKNQFNSC